MIEVQLPDGRVVEVDAPDAQSAAVAARKFLVRSGPPQNNASGADEAGMIASAPPPQRGNLNVGVQGASKGIGELAFGIPDLVNMATNLGIAGADKASQFVGGPSIDFRFPMPSEEAAKVGTNLAAKAGVMTTDPAAMTHNERLAYNVNRYGAQVAGAIPAMERLAVKRAGEISQGDALPKFFDKIVEPYRGGAAGRTVIGDAAGAAGSGIGETIAQDYSDNPALQMAGAVGGGVGGVGALGLTEGLGRMLAMVGRKMFGGNVARDIPLDPETGATTSKKAATEASRIVQNEAVGEGGAAGAKSRMQQNQGELSGNMGVLPSPAALSEDPGLIGLERRFRLEQPAKAVARDQKFNSSIRDTLDEIAPKDADTLPLRAKAGQEIDKRMGEAQSNVEHAQSYVDRTADVRRGQGDEVSGFRGQKPAASETLDREIVDRSLTPMDEARRRRYNEAPNVQLPGQPIYEAAQGIREGAGHLPPDARREVLPAERVRDLENLAAPIRDEDGNIIGYNDVPSRALNDLRPIVSADKGKARFENAAPGKIDNLRRVQDTITQQTENIPEYAEANRFYNEDYAPVYGREAGEAYKFRKDVNKDRLNRTASPPSETAGRFLVAGSPEKTEALQRIFTTMQDPQQAQSAARQYLMADLAEKNVIDGRTGVLRPNALRTWRIKNENTLGAVPGLQGEVDDIIARAEKGERVSGNFARELQQARSDLKITETQINKSALKSVMDADPDKTVARIMQDPTSSGQKLRELIKLTEGDDAARTGLKAAVRDYIVDKATTTANAKLKPGDRRGPVSLAKMTNIFNEHEKELAEIFNPEEMNTLRAGHRALELASSEGVRATTGSQTAGNIVDMLSSTPLGKGLEAFARLKFGLLKAGGLKATARRLSEGIGSDENAQIQSLIQRATVDPELMGLLLGRKVPISSPRWNARLNTLLGVAEGGRQEYKDE